MDNIDKKLLNITQTGFEITETPYRKIGSILEISEEETLSRLKKLKDEKVLRYIGASIDSSYLNFNGLLVAIKVPFEEIDSVAEIINSHPGVTHNYLRMNEFNMWFTILEPNSYEVEETTKKILEMAKIKDYMLLKPEKKYKLNFVVDANTNDYSGFKFEEVQIRKEKSKMELKSEDIRIIERLKQPLPINSRPFHALSEEFNISEKKLLKKLLDYKESGVIRKIGGIVSQTKLGYKYNALVLWSVHKDKIDEFAEKLANTKNISHCYRRTTYQNWDYSIYTMFHCFDENHFKELLKFLSDDEPVNEYMILRTEKELKKQRMNFSKLDYSKWHEYYFTNF
ncbi:AsnC family transcriptional regulator [uncultured Ilyobacter sp.]|uniref:siroheme decarboxylase subunit alpha n=1 Tax=uncultured Ilyobacter sp. TaxID=544433 RepID=UPI0029F4D596|nr:AsnC family transcriptional regulator [uncultured Ilyobacter sp.]